MNKAIYETETEPQTQRIDQWLPSGEGVGGGMRVGGWGQQI